VLDFMVVGIFRQLLCLRDSGVFIARIKYKFTHVGGRDGAGEQRLVVHCESATNLRFQVVKLRVLVTFRQTIVGWMIKRDRYTELLLERSVANDGKKTHVATRNDWFAIAVSVPNRP
jgi:hypothetical protein